MFDRSARQSSTTSRVHQHLAMLHRLRSMTSFIQIWIDEAIARAQAGDDPSSRSAIAGLDNLLAEMQNVYRESLRR